jgi:hypothetical protein
MDFSVCFAAKSHRVGVSHVSSRLVEAPQSTDVNSPFSVSLSMSTNTASITRVQMLFKASEATAIHIRNEFIKRNFLADEKGSRARLACYGKKGAT